MAKNELDPTPSTAPSGPSAPSELVRLPLGQNITGQGLLLATLGLLCLGVVMVHSAVATVTGPAAHGDGWEAKLADWIKRVDVRHLAYATIAAAVLMSFWRFDVRWLRGRRFPWAAAILLLVALGLCGLVLVPGIGHAVGGFKRWIPIGPITFQPSEILKLSLVIFLAAWLTRDAAKPRSFLRTFVPALVLIGGCMGLVITQDFGTAMLIAVSAGVTLLLSGVRWWYLVLLIGLAAVGFYFFVFLNPYRWQRVMTLVEPSAQDARATYQTSQSLLAVATGGWTGKGLGMGTIKLGYLPEDSTDFLFAIICEELGVLGAGLVMALVLAWVLLAHRAARRSADRFGAVLAGSLGFLIGLQAVLHMAVDLVVAPPKGLGLPFVSAGGTSLILMAGAAAMIVSVTSRCAATGPAGETAGEAPPGKAPAFGGSPPGGPALASESA
jgi:cell division protein FtsW